MPQFATAIFWLAALSYGTAVAQPKPDVSRQLAVLDQFVGTWDVTVTVTRPKKRVVTYSEVITWAPGRHWLRGDTGLKSDQTQEWSMTGFDKPSGGYHLWIFSSTGEWYYLAPGKWDEARRSIEWKSPPFSPVSHLTRCTFTDPRTRHCTSLVKDFKGSAVLEQEYTAKRREP